MGDEVDVDSAGARFSGDGAGDAVDISLVHIASNATYPHRYLRLAHLARKYKFLLNNYLIIRYFPHTHRGLT